MHLPALDEVNEQLGDSNKDQLTYPKMFFWLLLGMGLLPLGADLVVQSGSNLAAALGVSEALIGLTIVALGTSLPELATTVAAAIRKNADIALGNVVGSNIFNMLAIVGITTLIAELTIAPVFLQFDVWVMLVSSLFLTVLVWRKQVIGSKIGMLLLAGYGAYFYKLIVTA